MNSIGVKFTQKGSLIFSVWAPEKDSMLLHLVYPEDREVPMTKFAQGYFRIEVEGLSPETRYFFRPDGMENLPDPASHYQPEGVHGPSQVVAHHKYRWKDQNWKGIPFADLVLYELHVGTFTES